MTHQRENAMEQNTDHQISNGMDKMPPALIFILLSLMPLSELILMSLVSKQWEATVVSFLSDSQSNIYLSEYDVITSHLESLLKHCPFSAENIWHFKRMAQRKFIQFVERALFLHSGSSINTLQLSFQYNFPNGYIPRTRINDWVRFALTHNVKELELNFSEELLFQQNGWGNKYELPRGQFTPDVLEILILKFCKFRLSNFQVFRSLRRLSLVQVTLLDFTLEKLFLRCLVLEDVSLENCRFPLYFMVSKKDIPIKKLSIVFCEQHERPIYAIHLSTPCLEQFRISEKYLWNLQFKKATKVIDVFIDISEYETDRSQAKGLSSLLNGLQHCRSLRLSTWSIQVLPIVEFCLAEELNSFCNLKQLNLELGMTKEELPGISCLLRISPKLEILTLNIQSTSVMYLNDFDEIIFHILTFEEQEFWEKQNGRFNCLEHSLRTIIVHGFAGYPNEMKMIRFLLGRARMLENMDVDWSEENYIIQGAGFERQTITALRNFPRASARARITIRANPYVNV